MEPGLYVTFFSGEESFEDELPPVGPLDHMVVREGQLVADRKDVHQADHFGAGAKWLEAELEFERALGREPGPTRRRNMRISAPEGVYLRFVSFADAGEHDPIPELGPYAIVVVGGLAIEADGDVLARRTGARHDHWKLTGVGATALAGVIRPDIAVRTRSTAYHKDVKPFRPAPASQPLAVGTATVAVTHRPMAPPPAPPKPQPKPQTKPPATQPPAVSPPAPRPAVPPPESTLTLRDRIGDDQGVRDSGQRVASEGTPLDIPSAAWRLRFLIIATLIGLIAVFSVPTIRELITPGSTGNITVVGLAKDVRAPMWTYRVTNVKRLQRIGQATPRGVYLLVQLVATNGDREGTMLSPSYFSIIDAAGNTYYALPASNSVYATSENPSSSYIWTTSYPVGKGVATPLIFEVDPSAAGTMLVIDGVPNTRIRLE